MAQVAAIQQRQAAARAGHLTLQGQQELKGLKREMADAEGAADMSVLCGAVLLCCAVLYCAVRSTTQHCAVLCNPAVVWRTAWMLL